MPCLVDYARKQSYFYRGFTLVEMMVVLAILSILALMAMPSQEGKVNRARIAESLNLIEPYKSQIADYYALQGDFPQDNEQAGMPFATQITGNFLRSVEVENGVMHLELGNKIPDSLRGQIVSVRPVYVPDVANAPVSWICGYDVAPATMEVAGGNRTDVDPVHLPGSCR